MKNKKISAYLLTMIMSISLMSCSKQNKEKEPISYDNVLYRDEKLEGASSSIIFTFASKIMDTIIKKGEDTIKSEAFKWGKKSLL